MKKLIVVAGPTASGKTGLAYRLAKAFGGELVNADASQFYRGLSIGTAKTVFPDVKTHLLDIANPDERLSIAAYQRLARPVVEEIALPIVVGGSGLYINALIKDYDLTTARRNAARFAALSADALYERLKSLGCPYEIHPNNRRRMERYLALYEDTGAFTKRPPHLVYDALVIILMPERAALYREIDRRFAEFLGGGWLDEIKTLLAAGYDLQDAPALGYAMLADVVRGKVALAEAEVAIARATRRYAKRQYTWFKTQLTGHVFSDPTDPAIFALVKTFLEQT